MWTKRKLFIPSFCVLLYCLCALPCIGLCSDSTAAGTEVMTVSKADWIRLKLNSDAQKKALEESMIALTEANEALTASKIALDESERELEMLRKEYELQKVELTTLKAELATQKNESATAADALKKANQFLQDTKAEIEAREAAWRKRETQLERQRLEWQVLFALAAIGAGWAIAS